MGRMKESGQAAWSRVSFDIDTQQLDLSFFRFRCLDKCGPNPQISPIAQIEASERTSTQLEPILGPNPPS
jgi:hypothetical protein